MPFSPSDATSPPASKHDRQMASWNAETQRQYRYRVAVPGIHFLLDSSGSMIDSATALKTSYWKVVAHLQSILNPQTLIEAWTFNHASRLAYQGALYAAKPLTEEQYEVGGGTEMKPAIRRLLEATTSPGQHVLIVFTDGMDSTDSPTEYQLTRQILQQRQDEGWLCVYLGAFSDALNQGLSCGFTEGNCLRFDRYHLAEAFAKLQQGMQKFFQATDTEQRHLLTQGIFA